MIAFFHSSGNFPSVIDWFIILVKDFVSSDFGRSDLGLTGYKVKVGVCYVMGRVS